MSNRVVPGQPQWLDEFVVYGRNNPAVIPLAFNMRDFLVGYDATDVPGLPLRDHNRILDFQRKRERSAQRGQVRRTAIAVGPLPAFEMEELGCSDQAIVEIAARVVQRDFEKELVKSAPYQHLLDKMSETGRTLVTQYLDQKIAPRSLYVSIDLVGIAKAKPGYLRNKWRHGESKIADLGSPHNGPQSFSFGSCASSPLYSGPMSYGWASSSDSLPEQKDLKEIDGREIVTVSLDLEMPLSSKALIKLLVSAPLRLDVIHHQDDHHHASIGLGAWGELQERAENAQIKLWCYLLATAYAQAKSYRWVSVSDPIPHSSYPRNLMVYGGSMGRGSGSGHTNVCSHQLALYEADAGFTFVLRVRAIEVRGAAQSIREFVVANSVITKAQPVTPGD